MVEDSYPERIKLAFFALGRALLDVRGMVIGIREHVRISKDAAGQFDKDLTESLRQINEVFQIFDDAQPSRSVSSKRVSQAAQKRAPDREPPSRLTKKAQVKDKTNAAVERSPALELMRRRCG